jgi:hypothetical protein
VKPLEFQDEEEGERERKVLRKLCSGGGNISGEMVTFPNKREKFRAIGTVAGTVPNKGKGSGRVPVAKERSLDIK